MLLPVKVITIFSSFLSLMKLLFLFTHSKIFEISFSPCFLKPMTNAFGPISIKLMFIYKQIIFNNIV